MGLTRGDRGLGHSPREGPAFLTSTLSCQCLLQSALFSRLQVEGMPLGISDDVFVLHLSLETPQCALKRLAILHMNFSQLFSLSLQGYS